MPGIKNLGRSVAVQDLVQEIDNTRLPWGEFTLRTEQKDSPHSGTTDLWVRYNKWDNFDGDHAKFNGQHESVWYSCYYDLPKLAPVVGYVCGLVDAAKLGGVLITKIAPGGRVEPHRDFGWHAEYYDKVAVQLKGNKDQVFGFEDSELRPLPGQIYTFNNQMTHWVENNSDEERMTLIVCVKPHSDRSRVCLGQ